MQRNTAAAAASVDQMPSQISAALNCCSARAMFPTDGVDQTDRRLMRHRISSLRYRIYETENNAPASAHHLSASTHHYWIRARTSVGLIVFELKVSGRQVDCEAHVITIGCKTKLAGVKDAIVKYRRNKVRWIRRMAQLRDGRWATFVASSTEEDKYPRGVVSSLHCSLYVGKLIAKMEAERDDGYRLESMSVRAI
uniref:DBD_Tnp_Mut domain-containing protein n=1 Tax=Ascaris lumbricoides TaxID=6252 RepID=A0A0M3HPP3_ASCLU